MPDPSQREQLALRAADIYNAGGVTYQEAIGQAMAELNPAGDPDVVETLMRALLNVPEPPPVPARHRTPIREEAPTPEG